LKQAGSSRARYNAAGYSQVDAWEKITSMDNLEKGDLLFFSTNGKSVGHVGIYIGNGYMIDASSSNGKVVKRSCVTNFWKNNFVVARRPW
jgi:cell wall-associated NlpC family hydrolase